MAADRQAAVGAAGQPAVFSQAFIAWHAFQCKGELRRGARWRTPPVFVYVSGSARICWNHSN